MSVRRLRLLNLVFGLSASHFVEPDLIIRYSFQTCKTEEKKKRLDLLAFCPPRGRVKRQRSRRSNTSMNASAHNVLTTGARDHFTKHAGLWLKP